MSYVDHENPHCWVENYGISFISHVLKELGHPSEPVNTLAEVLEQTNFITQAYIISLDHASKLHRSNALWDNDEEQYYIKKIQKRIKARQKRELQDKQRHDQKSTHCVIQL